MPVLESTEFTTPRSALRHRPIGDEGTKPEKHTANAPIPPVQRASRTRPTDSQVEVDEWEREAGNASTKTQERPSVRRSSTLVGSKTRSQKPTGTQRLSKAKQAMKRHTHPLFYLGLGMLSMLILWTVAMAAVNWYNDG